MELAFIVIAIGVAGFISFRGKERNMIVPLWIIAAALVWIGAMIWYQGLY